MANLQDLPPALQRLQRRLIGEINVLSDAMENDEITIAEWTEEMQDIIGHGMNSGLMVGKGERSLTSPERAIADRLTAVQFAFLENFANEISQDGWLFAFVSRAQMYASATTASYSYGNVIKQAGQILPLPAMPTEGTQCLSNCGCEWEVVTINEQTGDFDAFWRLGKEDNCQTCLQRASDWSPVQIRGNQLLL